MNSLKAFMIEHVEASQVPFIVLRVLDSPDRVAGAILLVWASRRWVSRLPAAPTQPLIDWYWRMRASSYFMFTAAIWALALSGRPIPIAAITGDSTRATRCALITFASVASSIESAILVATLHPVDRGDEVLHGVNVPQVQRLILLVLELVGLLDDRVHWRLLPIHDYFGRLREDVVPEALEAALVGGPP